MELSLLGQLAIAVGLGALVGFQRQWADEPAGIRTFVLIAVFGVLTAALAESFGGWIVAAGLVALTALLVLSNMLDRGLHGSGMTTEIAALVVYGLGAALVAGYTTPAIAVGGGMAVLLYSKRPLHTLVERVDESELRAIIQLVLIALVILPILPDRTFGPYQVLNPFHIWLMVVLIVGISLAAYLAYKLLGPRVGTVLAGILGGLISSTATMVSAARRAKRTPAESAIAAVVVTIASAVVFGRVLLEIAVVAPGVLRGLAPPIAAMMVVMVLVAGVLWLVSGRGDAGLPEPHPETDLKAAIVFGLLYAFVIFMVAAAKTHLGERGLYLVAFISGLTDMDAITLSTAQLVRQERLDPETGWRMILVASLSNLVFKLVIVAVAGPGRLLARLALPWGIAIASGVAILLFWPW